MVLVLEIMFLENPTKNIKRKEKLDKNGKPLNDFARKWLVYKMCQIMIGFTKNRIEKQSTKFNKRKKSCCYHYLTAAVWQKILINII